MMLSYRGESYHYRMAWDYFGVPWPEAKPGLPFRQLPMLVTETGQQIVQSGSIMRYLAARLDLTSPTRFTPPPSTRSSRARRSCSSL